MYMYEPFEKIFTLFPKIVSHFTKMAKTRERKSVSYSQLHNYKSIGNGVLKICL